MTTHDNPYSIGDTVIVSVTDAAGVASEHRGRVVALLSAARCKVSIADGYYSVAVEDMRLAGEPQR